jgi:nucleoside-diphosphate-sugar epimerase
LKRVSFWLRKDGGLELLGGAGYIGSSLVKHFVSSFDVRLFDVKRPMQNLESSVDFQTCDVRNFEEVKRSLEDVDLVIHACDR